MIDTTLVLAKACLQMLRGNVLFLALALFVLTGTGIAADVYIAEERAVLMVTSLISFAAQYFVTRRLVGVVGLSRRPNVVVPYFLMSMVSGLAVLIGLIFLVVPGWWLAARWTAAGPVLFCENVGAIDSLGRSINVTRGRVIPIMILLALTWVPVAVVIPLIISDPAYAITTSFAANIGVSVTQLLMWCVAVIVYHDADPAAIGTPASPPVA